MKCVPRWHAPTKFESMNNLALLHRALIDALLQNRPHAIDQPVTVAEIYQDLIPYRNVRSTLGFALNADYEHALLQLLAGQDGYVTIEPPEAREALRAELQSSNPNVGMFRNYAACDVIVTIPTEAHERAQSPNGSLHNDVVAQSDWLQQHALEQTAPAESAANGGAAQKPEPRPHPAAAAKPVAPPQASAAAPSTCAKCSMPLPTGRAARFCPYCGYDQTKRVCRSCKEPLEKDWQFCVSCGTPTE